MSFQVFFGFVLRVLFEFKNSVAMQWFSAAARYEIVLVDVPFQSTFAAVNCGSPWVVCVRRIFPRTVLPDDWKVCVLKRGGLSVRDVSLSISLYEDSAI